MANTQTPPAFVQPGTKVLGNASGISSSVSSGSVSNSTTGSTSGTTSGSTSGTTSGSTSDTTNTRIITKFQFRKLFTLAERTKIDNIEYDDSFSGSIKATVNTIMTDLNVSATVNLDLADVISGVTFLQQIGILTAERVARILSGQMPL